MRWLVTAVVLIGLALVTPRVAAAKKPPPTPFESVRIIIEFNSTAQDAGIQLFVDAEAWKTVSVLDPKGHKIFEVSPKGKLRALGGSELFVESDEPDIAEVPLSDLFAQFPEGTYTFVGTSPDGEKLKSTATFSHVIPDGPTITSAGTLDPAHATIAWNAVTTPAGVAIAGYEVVIEHDDFHFFDVKVPATTTNVTVPPQLLQLTTQYGFEVLAIDATGNQTITESSFTTQ